MALYSSVKFDEILGPKSILVEDEVILNLNFGCCFVRIPSLCKISFIINLSLCRLLITLTYEVQT